MSTMSTLSRPITFLLLTLLALTTLTATPSAAQQGEATPALPDYRIQIMSNAVDEATNQITLEFTITNGGGPASREATVILTNATTGEQLGLQAIDPLGGDGDSETIAFDFSAAQFTPGSLQSFSVTVGIDEIELRNSPTIGNNTARTSVTIPGGEGSAFQPPDATTEAPVGSDTTDETPATDGDAQTAETDAGNDDRISFEIGGQTIQLPDLPFDIPDQLIFAALIAALGIGLVLIWVITVILRLVLQRPPTFPAWQAAYATTPFLDPNTLAGRRQLWQQHAQNDAFPSGTVDGNMHIRKLLLGAEGGTLTGWKITAIRMSQYDMYGRIARSNTIFPNKNAKRLSSIAKRGKKLDAQKVSRRVRPVARQLLARFKRHLNKKTMMLPIVLDLRLEGSHGEVQIIFELHQSAQGGWRLIDTWQPEMTVYKGTIQENYTYTFHGQRPGERANAFRKRLRDELTATLTNMIKQAPVPAQPLAQAPQQPTPPPTTPGAPVPGAATMETSESRPVDTGQ